MKLTKLFTDFFESEKSSGLILILCTAISLIIANLSFGGSYMHFWHTDVLSKPLEFWINDGLMTIFFLLVGLEIEREIYIGELSEVKKALLPTLAAIGGMLVPAGIHFLFNHGTGTQKGIGIPMATDIAFSLAILSLLGNKVPDSLKVFLIALAIIDDLGAIIVIALFYSKNFSLAYFLCAMGLFLIMIILNRLKVYKIWVYLTIGCIMWFCMYRSGIHATITGVLLAFAIPFCDGGENSVSYKLQHFLHKPVAFLILPFFALANTCVMIPSTWTIDIASSNSIGIILGLLIGKPLGIFLFAAAGIALGICLMPSDLKKTHLLGAGILAGIGFTMSIFITLLAFSNPHVIDASKVAVMVGSLLSGITGFLFLKSISK